MTEDFPVVLTEFGFVIARGDKLPFTGAELRGLPADLRPDIAYGAREDAYHWSRRYVARQAAALLTERARDGR